MKKNTTITKVVYNNFIGIDIAKSTFVVAIDTREEVKSFSNTQSGFKVFQKEFENLLPTH